MRDPCPAETLDPVTPRDDVLVYSCIVGGYDAQPDPAACRFIMERRSGEHPRLTAKRPKMLRMALPIGDWRYAIWIDGNIRIRTSWFWDQAVEATGDKPLGVFAHPRRDDIVAEAHASHIEAPEKYADLPLVEQAMHYRDVGVPSPSGLYCGGVVCWNLAHRDTRQIGARWYTECEEWTYQDQLSLPYVLWKMGVEPAVFPFPILEPGLPYIGNRWVQLLSHIRDD